jgi:hypothetical protein
MKKGEAMKNTWSELSDQFDRKQRDLQDRILAIPGSQRVLRKLRTEGANRETVLSLLADAVEHVDFWRKPVRGIKAELLSVASQLETLAEHAGRISLDLAFSGSFWLAVLALGKWEMVKPRKDSAPTWVFDSMRIYAKNCRDKAQGFGKLLSTRHAKSGR